MLLVSVGQELGEWIVGMAYLCSAMSEDSVGQALRLGGDSTAGGWNHLMASSCIILVIDAGYWLGTQRPVGSNTYIGPLDVATWLLPAWWLAFMSQYPKRQGLKVQVS